MPKRGSRLCGSLSSATTRPPDGGDGCPHPPTIRVRIAAKDAICLTLFRGLCYPRSRTTEAGLGASMPRRSFQLALILSAFTLTATVRAETFPRPAVLEPQVKFWRSIFSEYSKYQVVLHDAVDLDKVYKVLDFRPYVDQGMTEGEVERLLRAETAYELERVRTTLRWLQENGGDPGSLGAEERHVYDLYRNDESPYRFLEAAGDKRLHSQRGLREKFMEGLRVGRHFFPDMERIFREEGLPPELTRLPLIESC